MQLAGNHFCVRPEPVLKLRFVQGLVEEIARHSAMALVSEATSIGTHKLMKISWNIGLNVTQAQLYRAREDTRDISALGTPHGPFPRKKLLTTCGLALTLLSAADFDVGGVEMQS